MADTAIATDLQDGIVDIMNEVGESGYVRKISKSASFNSSDSTQGRVTTITDIAVSLKFFDYKDYLVDGSIIKQGDKKTLVSLKSTGIVVDENDTILNSGKTEHYKVVNVQRVFVSGVEVTDICQVRE